MYIYIYAYIQRSGSSVCNMKEGYDQWQRTGPRDEDGHFRWGPYSAGQSGAANSGAIEPAEATPARTRDAEAPQEASNASDASVAEPSAEVLLGIAELQRLQQGGVGKGRLHKEARSLLNEKSRFFAVSPENHVRSLPIHADNWPRWKEYIAGHKDAARLVGSNGIVKISIEEIEGTSDPNRRGSPRVDFVVYNADGNCFRLHPGNKPSSDAQLIAWKTVGGAHEPAVCQGVAVETASEAYRWPPEVYTQDYGDSVPQVDRMGRRQMFAKLQNLPLDRPLELTNATIEEFPWWLWVPTIGRDANKIIGDGIERVALMETWTATKEQSDWNWARFLFVHRDKTAVLLTARYDGRDRISYRCKGLPVGSPEHAWLVNWR